MTTPPDKVMDRVARSIVMVGHVASRVNGLFAFLSVCFKMARTPPVNFADLHSGVSVPLSRVLFAWASKDLPVTTTPESGKSALKGAPSPSISQSFPSADDLRANLDSPVMVSRPRCPASSSLASIFPVNSPSRNSKD